MNVYIRVIVEFLVVANGFLASLGITYFESITAESIYIIVSLVAALCSFGYAVWKNHNFTDAAKKAQKVLEGLKEKE